MIRTISLAARVDATEFTFQQTDLFTWTQQTPKLGQSVYLSTLLWMFSWATLATPLSLALDHNDSQAGAGPRRAVLVGQFDLHSAGYTGAAPTHEQWGLHLRLNPLCFTGDNLLIATFVARESVAVVVGRDQKDKETPFVLNAVVLQMDTPKMLAAKRWPLTHPQGGIVSATKGGFAVLTPSMIALYAGDLSPLGQLDLSAEQQSHLWTFHTSPNGNSILVEYHYPQSLFQWVDFPSLRPQAVWSDSLPGVSIANKTIAFSDETFTKETGLVHKVLIRASTGSEQTLCRAVSGQSEHCGEPQFISDDNLALLTPHSLIARARVGGDPILTAKFRDDEWLGPQVFPSADGKRFAVTVWAHKGGNELFDINYHNILKRIIVYDVENQRAIYELDGKHEKLKSASGVALSADGSIIAILSDALISVYRFR